eukprot:TRINITY_DN78_c0_g1_i2.p1 TRINITY_DN78_c0_g1~~TRINITY_DN78_c0_g1_i2.p1  ORF type:complete len:527 (-),score=31.34 TRINITY_DN78_c0_g1_i2:1264-2844(-)
MSNTNSSNYDSIISFLSSSLQSEGCSVRKDGAVPDERQFEGVTLGGKSLEAEAVVPEGNAGGARDLFAIPEGAPEMQGNAPRSNGTSRHTASAGDGSAVRKDGAVPDTASAGSSALCANNATAEDWKYIQMQQSPHGTMSSLGGSIRTSEVANFNREVAHIDTPCAKRNLPTKCEEVNENREKEYLGSSRENFLSSEESASSEGWKKLEGEMKKRWDVHYIDSSVIDANRIEEDEVLKILLPLLKRKHSAKRKAARSSDTLQKAIKAAMGSQASASLSSSSSLFEWSRLAQASGPPTDWRDETDSHFAQFSSPVGLAGISNIGLHSPHPARSDCTASPRALEANSTQGGLALLRGGLSAEQSVDLNPRPRSPVVKTETSISRPLKSAFVDAPGILEQAPSIQKELIKNIEIGTPIIPDKQTLKEIGKKYGLQLEEDSYEEESEEGDALEQLWKRKGTLPRKEQRKQKRYKYASTEMEDCGKYESESDDSEEAGVGNVVHPGRAQFERAMRNMMPNLNANARWYFKK